MAIRINYTVHSVQAVPVEVDAEVTGLGSVRANIERLLIEAVSEDGSMSAYFRVENTPENNNRYAANKKFTLEDTAPYEAPVVEEEALAAEEPAPAADEPA